MADYSKWTLDDAQDTAPAVGSGHQANLKFVVGNHWQGGAGWIGPMLASTESGYSDALERVEKGFVSRNVIGEIVETHLAGVIGRQPHINVSLRRPLEKGEEPTEEEQQLISEAQALITSWWDARRAIGRAEDGSGALRLCSMHELLQDAGVNLLATTRAAFRIVIDPAIRRQEEGGRVTIEAPASIEEALQHLMVAHPSPGAATVYTPLSTLQSVGVYTYMQDDDERAELSYLDASGKTVTRIVTGDGEEVSEPFALGGRLTIHEVQRDLYLGEPLRRLQKALNLIMTLMSRNLVSGGFLERLFLNTSKPGSWEYDKDAGKWTHTPADNIQLGEGTTNFLHGLPIYDKDGRHTGYTNPQVEFREPADSQTFIQAAGAIHRAMLEEAKQLHTLISDDATASGESRIQAKTDFKNSLRLTKPAVDAALRWLFETLLALASDLAGQAGRFEDLRVNVDAQLDVGVATGNELTSTIEAMQAGLVGRASAMRRIGVEDVEAMEEEVDSDALNLLYWLGKKAEIAQTMGLMDVNMAAVLDILGFSEDSVRELTRQDTIPPARGFSGNGREEGIEEVDAAFPGGE